MKASAKRCVALAFKIVLSSNWVNYLFQKVFHDPKFITNL